MNGGNLKNLQVQQDGRFKYKSVFMLSVSLLKEPLYIVIEIDNKGNGSTEINSMHRVFLYFYSMQCFVFIKRSVKLQIDS